MILLLSGKCAKSQTADIELSYSIPVKTGKKNPVGYNNTGINPDLTLNDSTLSLRVNRLSVLSRIKKIVFYRLKSGDIKSKKILFKKIAASGKRQIRNNLKYQEDKLTGDMAKWRFYLDHGVDTSFLKNKYSLDFNRYLTIGKV